MFSDHVTMRVLARCFLLLKTSFRLVSSPRVCLFFANIVKIFHIFHTYVYIFLSQGVYNKVFMHPLLSIIAYFRLQSAFKCSIYRFYRKQSKLNAYICTYF